VGFVGFFVVDFGAFFVEGFDGFLVVIEFDFAGTFVADDFFATAVVVGCANRFVAFGCSAVALFVVTRFALDRGLTGSTSTGCTTGLGALLGGDAGTGAELSMAFAGSVAGLRAGASSPVSVSAAAVTTTAVAASAAAAIRVRRILDRRSTGSIAAIGCDSLCTGEGG
jgi:hypothetical protein